MVKKIAGTPRPSIEPEPAHETQAVEWWFVQGAYAGADGAWMALLVTLFRSNVRHGDDAAPENGFQLVLAVLDAEGRNHTVTWIDEPVLREAAEKLRTRRSPIDPVVQRALLEELEAHGPPRPIQVKARPSQFRASPLEVRWEGFALWQEGGVFHLEFDEPGTGRPVRLRLLADAGRMRVPRDRTAVPLGAGMAYRTYPRLRLEGTRDGAEPLRGHAWLDHQWGSTDWFHDPTAKTLLGWDWFGINLDDGSDWLVMLHRDARSGAPVAHQATMRGADGRTRTSRRFTLTPLRFWESPRTHVRYPVAWRIEVEDLDAVLEFEPAADDQEVPTFSINHGLWEGAGRVRGTVAGRPVAGRARGEFQGYGYVFDHDAAVRRMAERVDARLEEVVPRRFETSHIEALVGPARWSHEVDAYTRTLSVPLWDLVDRSGKRWRPLLGLLLLESLGVASAPYERLICSLELIHAGALIVDDIEDGSLLRRGEECLHLRYGLDVALNTGNALYFLPGAVLMRHPLLSAEQRLRLHEIKEQVCIEAHCGQATDIHWSRTLTPGDLRRRLAKDVEAKILQMYAFKTAAASKGVAECAAAIAGANRETAAACREFGLALGVSYQVIDDVHNFSRSPDWTKTPGEDIASGKLTYVIVAALRRLDPPGRARLEGILGSEALRRDPACVREGAELVRASGALEASAARAREWMEEAWAAFSKHLPPTPPKIMLRAMVLTLVDCAFDG